MAGARPGEMSLCTSNLSITDSAVRCVYEFQSSPSAHPPKPFVEDAKDEAVPVDDTKDDDAVYAEDDDKAMPIHGSDADKAKAIEPSDDDSSPKPSLCLGTRVIASKIKQETYKNARGVVVDGKTPLGRVAVKFDDPALGTKASNSTDLEREPADAAKEVQNAKNDDTIYADDDDKPEPIKVEPAAGPAEDAEPIEHAKPVADAEPAEDDEHVSKSDDGKRLLCVATRITPDHSA